MEKEVPAEKKTRGWGLSLLLILMLCGQVYFGYLLLTSLLAIPYHPLAPAETVVPIERLFGTPVPTWYPIALEIITVLDMGCLIGIWLWKKWGVYGLFATWFIGILVNLTAGGISALSNMISSLIPLVILGFLIKRKWQFLKW